MAPATIPRDDGSPPAAVVDTPARASVSTRARWRVIAFATLIGGLLATWALLHDRLPTPLEVRETVGDAGLWTLLLAVPIIIGLKLVVFPSSVVSIAAGLVYGTFLGTAVVVVAATIAACVQLVLGRSIAGREIRSNLPAWSHRYDRFIERRGWLAVATLRLMPVSHNTLNYALGFTSLKVSHMALGTAVGAGPMAFAYAVLGGNAHDLTSPAVLGAIALLTVLALVGVLLLRRHSGEEREEPEQA